jgi:hypothetical protein
LVQLFLGYFDISLIEKEFHKVLRSVDNLKVSVFSKNQIYDFEVPQNRHDILARHHFVLLKWLSYLSDGFTYVLDTLNSLLQIREPHQGRANEQAVLTLDSALYHLHGVMSLPYWIEE